MSLKHPPVQPNHYPRLYCARTALSMIDYDTQKLWMKFVLSLGLFYFVIEHGAEATYIGFLVAVMWSEFSEFARAYRDVRLQQQNET